MDINSMLTRKLLEELVGVDETARVYKGSIREVFQHGSPSEALRPLLIARELWERMYEIELMERDVLTSPALVANYLAAVYVTKPYEVFLALYLDAQNRLIETEELFRGTLTQTAVYPRVVVHRALEVGAAGLIVSHNHPSGVAEPSRADEYLTQTLKSALMLVDVKLLDHVVFGSGKTVSMAERGLV